MSLSRKALSLRGRALAILAGPESAASSGASAGTGDASFLPPRTGEAALRLFLDAERCAGPIGRALFGPGGRGASREALRVLRDRNAAERQRAMAGRTGLADVDAVAGRLGSRLAVLGAGVLLPSEDVLDVGRVDLLVAADAARPLVEALGERGYRAGKTPGLLRPARAGGDGAVPLQVRLGLPTAGRQWTGTLLRRSDRLDGSRNLRRLAPADQLWYVLHQGVVQHPNRRGRLRDLLLAARAWQACDRSDRESTRERFRDDPQGSALSAQLAMAAALASGRVPEDRFRREAAGRYLLWSLLEPEGQAEADGEPLMDGLAARLGSRADRREEWRRRLRLSSSRFDFAGVGSVEDREPGGGHVWRAPARLVDRALVAGTAIFLAVATRWIAFRAQ